MAQNTNNLKKTIKQVTFLGLGAALMWYVFSKLDMDQFLKDAGSMNYWYFLGSGIFAMSSHYIRALRWKQLIEPTGYQPKTKNVFASVLFMYASNLAFPRSGEIARCGTLYKYEKIPVATLLGTVVVERAIDLISLLLFTASLFFIQFDVLEKLYFQSSLPQMVESIWTNKVLIVILIFVVLIGAIGFLLLRKRIFALGPFQKIGHLLEDLINSLKSVRRLKGFGRFILYTLSIWGCYVGMFYICFFAFEPTSHLTISIGLTAFIAGSFGMVVPSPGGAGVWQIFVALALTSFGISEQDAMSWANVAFILMTFTVATAGIIAFFSLPYLNKSKEA